MSNIINDTCINKINLKLNNLILMCENCYEKNYRNENKIKVANYVTTPMNINYQL